METTPRAFGEDLSIQHSSGCAHFKNIDSKKYELK